MPREKLTVVYNTWFYCFCHDNSKVQKGKMYSVYFIYIQSARALPIFTYLPKIFMNLTIHSSIYPFFASSGERPFQCDVCNKGFTRKDKMVHHRLKQHAWARPLDDSESRLKKKQLRNSFLTSNFLLGQRKWYWLAISCCH